jgi:hypothetical protein
MNGFNKSLLAVVISGCAVAGCATSKTTSTARTASEQLLISGAIDRAFSNVRFQDFAGYKVFVDEKYLDSVDKGYLVGSLRHKILAGGGYLVGAADAADLVLEPRSGGVGTDSQESFIGIPSLGIPGLPIELPEVKFASKATHMGTAKVGLVCYNPKTGESVGIGGNTTAVTHHSDTYLVGMGPFRSGSVVEQRQRAVGFSGVGGSVVGATKIARASAPVDLIRDNLPGALENEPVLPGMTAEEQIAESPETITR